MIQQLHHRHALMIALLAVLSINLVTGCARFEHPKLVQPDDVTPENVRAKIVLLYEGGQSAPSGIRQRLAEGKNLQAMIQIPEGNNPGGALLDPESVKVTWNEVEQPTYVFYKTPQVAIIFTTLNRDLPTTNSALTMTASRLGSNTVEAGWQLPVTFEGSELDRFRAPAKEEGRGIVVSDATNSAPIAGAYVFGQRREDLLGRADTDGVVVLTAPTRNTMDEHVAMAEGYWARRFNPISEQEIKLTPRRENRRNSKLRLNITDAAGAPIPRALVLVNDTYYAQHQAGKRTALELRAEGENDLLIVAPGCSPKFVSLDAKARTVDIVMEPLNASRTE